jgi:hypothetical protein
MKGMNRRRILTLGVILLVLGCTTSLYLALTIVNAKIRGVFSTMASDSPTTQFENFQCPLLLNENETASVVATISNPCVGYLTHPF